MLRHKEDTAGRQPCRDLMQSQHHNVGQMQIHIRMQTLVEIPDNVVRLLTLTVEVATTGAANEAAACTVKL